MRSIVRRGVAALSLFLAASLLSGCVTTPDQQAFNREAAPSLETIQVLPMRESEIDLFILNNPGYQFGLVGVAIAEANRIPKRNAMREAAQAQDFDHVAVFRERLTRAFAERGYTLRWPDPVMEGDGGPKARRTAYGLHKAYAPAAAGVDAQLDVSFGYVGFAAAGTGKGAPYRPTAVISARLVDPAGREVWFSDFIVYNNVFNQQKAITLDPSDRYVYPDYDDLEAAWPEAIQGLREAVETVADELARQL
jgi:hypothetical protein